MFILSKISVICFLLCYTYLKNMCLFCLEAYHDKRNNKTYPVKIMRNGVKEAILNYEVVDYNNELDIWFEPDEEIFPEGCGEWGLNGLIETNGISDDEVFDLLYEGANNYINEIYGKDWKEKYPEPKSE